MKTHAQILWVRTLGNLSYLLGTAFLIAAMAVNAMPVGTAGAADTNLLCALPQYDAGHYALNPGQSVTCTINFAVFIGSPTQLRVYMVHPTLGTAAVWGDVYGTTITFSYTGRSNGCDTENIRYSNNAGSAKGLSGIKGFGYPDPCGDTIPTNPPAPPVKTATPTNTRQPAPSATPTRTATRQPGPSVTPTSATTGQPGPGVTPTDPGAGTPTATPSPLIPVTGVHLGAGGAQTSFFNLGIAFLGLGMVLNGLARARKELDL